MTDTDKRAFLQAFNLVAVSTRLSDADAVMHRVYFEGLRDFAIEAVTGAAAKLAQTSEFFPKVAQWRAEARIAAVSMLVALPAGRDTPWEDECGACLDTGWEERRCYPGTRDTCGRRKCQVEGKEHTYGTMCACRPTNRTFARHHLTGPRADAPERM